MPGGENAHEHKSRRPCLAFSKTASNEEAKHGAFEAEEASTKGPQFTLRIGVCPLVLQKLVLCFPVLLG